MKRVDGYVLLVSMEGSTQFLMGKPMTNVGGPMYESLMTNGCTPFSGKGVAHRAATAIRKRRTPDFKKVQVARLKMEIAETDLDLPKLWAKEGRAKFVVLQLPGAKDLYPQTMIWGRSLPGRSTTLYALDICQNGMLPFPTRFEAERCAYEVARQGRSPAAPATFSLTFLVRKSRKKRGLPR